MKIAADLCIYTNHNTTMEVINAPQEATDGQTRPILGYWDVRGKGAQCHYVLAYCGVDYEAKTYIRGPPPEFSKAPWTDVRAELNLDFPNLPYLIDGDVKLTESKSIMKYVAKKYDADLLGRNAEEIAKADMMSRVHDSLYDRIGVHFKKGDPENFVKQIDIVGQMLANYLRSEKPFVVGS